MIVVSLLLIAGAATMLVLGVWHSSSELLSGSIAASLLAAILLVVGARRGATLRPGQERAGHERTGRDRDQPDRDRPGGSARDHPTATLPAVPDRGERPPGAGAAANPPTRTIPAQHGAPAAEAPAGGAPAGGSPGRDGDHPEDEVDPPDEPAPQQVSAADAAKVGQMLTEVLVVDGRPRYHLAGCVHLLGREHEPLPVNEAIELGFSPCSLCEPDSALLADARRV